MSGFQPPDATGLPAPSGLDANALLSVRAAHMGSNLSLSYSPHPLHIVKGEGAVLMAADCTKYVDLVNNVAHLGHSHPAITAAASAQLSVLNTNTRYINEQPILYAKELSSLFPDPLSVVFFVNSGSEANDLALRIARAHTKGGQVTIALDHAYHGASQACIDVSAYKFNGKGGAGCPPNTLVALCPDAYRGLYRPEPAPESGEQLRVAHGTGWDGGVDGDDEEAEWGGPNGYSAALATGRAYAADVARLCDTLLPAPSHQDPAAEPVTDGSIMAFIAESYLGCGGQIALPPGYLDASFKAVRAKGGVCIIDEVQVGFGRVGSHMWAFEMQDVIPDIVTLGKPIGNGWPIGAVVTTPAIAASFANGMEFFSTFGGSTASALVGRTVIASLLRERLRENAAEVGRAMRHALRQRVWSRHRAVGDVRGHGLFVGIEIVAPVAGYGGAAALSGSSSAAACVGSCVQGMCLCMPKAMLGAECKPKTIPLKAVWSEKTDQHIVVLRDGSHVPSQDYYANTRVHVHNASWRAPAPAAASWLVVRLCDRYHFLASTDGPYASVIKVKPPMCLSREQAVGFAEALDMALREMAEEMGELWNVVTCDGKKDKLRADAR